MKYYKVLFSGEYAKRNCKFGIIQGQYVSDEYEVKYGVKDEKPLPLGILKEVEFKFDDKPLNKSADFQMSYLPWRLISERFHEVLIKNEMSDNVTYYPFDVKYGDKVLKYYLMHFNEKVDALNKEKSKYLGVELWEPVLDLRKYPFPHVFNFRESKGVSFCISEEIKVEMEKNHITGCSIKELKIQ